MALVQMTILSLLAGRLKDHPWHAFMNGCCDEQAQTTDRDRFAIRKIPHGRGGRLAVLHALTKTPAPFTVPPAILFGLA